MKELLSGTFSGTVETPPTIKRNKRRTSVELNLVLDEIGSNGIKCIANGRMAAVLVKTNIGSGHSIIVTGEEIPVNKGAKGTRYRFKIQDLPGLTPTKTFSLED